MGDEDALKILVDSLTPDSIELEERKLIPLIDIDRLYSIIEDDVNKFIEKSTRLKYTLKEIKIRFSDKYKDLFKVTDLRDADIIPEHYFYNYKIELIVGKELLYFRAKPILF